MKRLVLILVMTTLGVVSRLFRPFGAVAHNELQRAPAAFGGYFSAVSALESQTDGPAASARVVRVVRK